jgi:hypothetical protein
VPLRLCDLLLVLAALVALVPAALLLLLAARRRIALRAAFRDSVLWRPADLALCRLRRVVIVQWDAPLLWIRGRIHGRIVLWAASKYLWILSRRIRLRRVLRLRIGARRLSHRCVLRRGAWLRLWQGVSRGRTPKLPLADSTPFKVCWPE